MSRIAAVIPWFLARPPDALSPREEHAFLLQLVTEDGLTGWGEAHGSPYMLRAAVEAPVTHPSAQGLRHLLEGADCSDVAALRTRLERGTQWIGGDGVVTQAIAAAELAAWDLAGQRAGLPVARLWCARPSPWVRAYASGKVGATPAATAARLVAQRDGGFTAFKIGWPPFGADLAADLAFLAAARDTIGPAPLMLDAAQAWDLPAALARLEAFAPFSPAWLEEPLPRDALADQARLAAASATPIAAGEGACTLAGLAALVAGGCQHVLQPDATRCGALAFRAAADLALRRGLRLASHSFTTALNVTIHAHLLASLPPAAEAWLEWPVQPLAIWHDLFPTGPKRDGGMVAVPDRPGWGLAPDPAALARYARADRAPARIEGASGSA